MSRFTFGEVEAVLAELNKIASDKRVAFSSRLKNLQRQGLRSDTGSPGRGRVAKLNYFETVELAAGVELLRLGLPPQRAASLISKSSQALLHTAYLATHDVKQLKELATLNGRNEADMRHVWLVRFDALAEMTIFGSSDYDDYEAVEALSLPQVRSVFEIGAMGGDDDVDGVPRRHLAINGTALCQRLVHIAAYTFQLATPAEMREDVHAEGQRVEDLLAEFDLANSERSSRGDT